MGQVSIDKLYSDGDYHNVLNAIQSLEDTPFELHLLYQMTLVRANYTVDAVMHRLNLLNAAILDDDTNLLKIMKNELKQNLLLNVSTDILSSMLHLARECEIEVEDITSFNNKDTYIVPIVWPIAYGDMIVAHQFIKDMKKQCKKIILIMPLNRPELKQLAEINDIDKIIDITLMPEEELNRHKTLTLINDKYGYLNVAVQEYVISKYLDQVPNAVIHKFRYLPLLYGRKYFAGWRIWETRANMFLNENKELPKLCNFKGKKKKQIVIHFRSGGYNNAESRDIKKNYAQKIIDRLNKEYPDYKIIRLRDKGMYDLFDCEEVFVEDTTIKEQAKLINASHLFIGSHSAPQHLTIACSNTPIICINYLAQETLLEMEDSIAKLSYEPVGKQVKKVMYVKAFDKDDNELLPIHNDKRAVRYDNVDIDELMKEVKEALNGD